VLLIISMGTVSSKALQQSFELTGLVLDNEGRHVEGVTVMLKGTSVGTATDEKGAFKLSIENGEDGVMTFTHRSYLLKEEPILNRQFIEVTLVEGSEDLEEVVVIGYGTAKRKDLTGAVSSIQAEKIEQEAPRSVQDLLRANAAGIIIDQGNSAKADASLLVRGKGTLKAGSSPLNVVDGVIFEGSFTDINPNDIESIDVLKDASATAVYGAKAANGVVLITTKRGKTGKPTISFNSNIGFAENAKMPRVMTADEFIDYRYDYQIGRRTEDYLNTYPEMFNDPRRLSKVDPLTWYN